MLGSGKTFEKVTCLLLDGRSNKSFTFPSRSPCSSNGPQKRIGSPFSSPRTESSINVSHRHSRSILSLFTILTSSSHGLFDDIAEYDNEFRTVAVYDNDIYVGGSFSIHDASGSLLASDIAVLVNGTTWSKVGNNRVNGSIENIEIDGQGNIIASGWFQENLLIVYDTVLLMNTGLFKNTWIRLHSRSSTKLPDPISISVCLFF